MNVIKKFLITSILICCFLLFFLTKSEATSIQNKASGFLTRGKNEARTSTVASSAAGSFAEIGQILTFIGEGIIVAVTAYLGVQYLMSPPDKQGALKEKLIGVVASGIVIFRSI